MRSSPAAARLELLLEAGHEPARAELDHLVAALPAGKGLAVEGAEEVHHHEVAGGRGPLDGLELGAALAHALELGLDRLGRDDGLAAADLEALVLAEPRRRPHADLDREAQRLALAGQLVHVQVGLADRHDARVVDRRGVPAGQGAAHRLVEHGLAADALDDHGRRDLAGAEAGDAEVAAELAGGVGEPAFDLVRRHLRLDAHARLGQLGDRGGDGGGHGRVNDTNRSVVRRLATWLVCGPLGHLAAGVLDVAAALVKARRGPDRATQPRSPERADDGHVMGLLRNLSLSVRLGLAFGLMAAALAIVAAIGASEISTQQSGTERLAGRDLPAVALAGAAVGDSAKLGRVTADHLYVHDGDLSAQDRLQRQARDLTSSAEEDLDKLDGLATAHRRCGGRTTASRRPRRASRAPPPRR